MQEAEAWKRLTETRERCLAVVRGLDPDQVDAHLLEEIADVERVVRDLWWRLEANSHKRFQSSVAQGTLAQRWAQEVVIPLTVAWTLCDSVAAADAET